MEAWKYEFIFLCSSYTEFEHSKINVISLRAHVLFSI
jgi:hypothetical protein